LQQVKVTPELVDDPGLDVRLVSLVEQLEGAVHRSKNPTAIDVTDHHHRKVNGACQPHVHVVTTAEVDLSR